MVRFKQNIPLQKFERISSTNFTQSILASCPCILYFIIVEEMIHESLGKKFLMLQPYRNQWTALYCRSFDWFLYGWNVTIKDLRQKKQLTVLSTYIGALCHVATKLLPKFILEVVLFNAESFSLKSSASLVVNIL